MKLKKLKMTKPTQQNKVKKEHVDRREFSYAKGSCRLRFTLRTDVKTELRDFKECLQEAIKEVDEELNE